MEDPEPRAFYIKCPQCSCYCLDCGFEATVRCCNCNSNFDSESAAEEIRLVKHDERLLQSKLDKEVRELRAVVLLVEKDSLLDTFLEDDEVNYDLIAKRILLPYFKIKTRVLCLDKGFQIGEIAFKVCGMSPHRLGSVTSSTAVQLNR